MWTDVEVYKYSYWENKFQKETTKIKIRCLKK